jgi:hypothetical protein
MHVFAQSDAPSSAMKFTLSAGVSVPGGDFGKYSEFFFGSAKTGYGFMLNGIKPIGRNIDWTTTVNLSMNSFDTKSFEDNYWETIKARNYISTYVSTGLGIHESIARDVSVFGKVEVGPLFLRSPEIIVGANSNYQETVSIDLATAISYNFAVGINWGDVVCTIRYSYAKPELILAGYDYSSSWGYSTDFSVSLLQFTVGITM